MTTEPDLQPARKAREAAATSRWAVPGRITIALDARLLDGPDVDRACGVREPVVDLWEAGVLLPDRGQVARLSRLTGMAPEYFYEMEPLPGGRMFLCSRRKEFREVIEPGEGANPVCDRCGRVCWMAVETARGRVLLEGPDPDAGTVVMAVLGRTRRMPRRLRWGVRPVGKGELVDAHLRRRPHACSPAVLESLFD